MDALNGRELVSWITLREERIIEARLDFNHYALEPGGAGGT